MAASAILNTGAKTSKDHLYKWKPGRIMCADHWEVEHIHYAAMQKDE